MGSGGGLFGGVTNTLFGSPKTVDVPNYTSAAQQTSASDLAANRLNQSNPYSALGYSQTGTDQYGNPTWTQTQTVAPQLQSAINANFSQLGQPFQAPTFSGQDMPGMNYFGSKLNAQQFNPATQLKPLAQYDVNTQINQAALPSYGINPGQTYSDAIMQRLQPSLQRQTQALDAQLANQGIMPGSKAYETAKILAAQGQNDALTSAIVGGMQTGLQANQQAYGQQAGQIGLNLQGQAQNFGQGLQGNQQQMSANDLAYQQQLANQALGMQAQAQAFSQAMGQSMLPYQQATALKGLASPSFASYATAMPTNYFGATQQGYQGNLANANAQNAYANSMINGLFNLGKAYIA
jgi:hypothetical protein